MSRFFGYLMCAGMALLFSSPVLAQQSQQGPGYGRYMWNEGWHGWFFGPIMFKLPPFGILNQTAIEL